MEKNLSLAELTKQLRNQAAILNQAADVLDGKPVVPQSQTTSSQPKRHLSAAARRKLSQAQKARWAVIKGGARRAA
jgi:hypothetical protein